MSEIKPEVAEMAKGMKPGVKVGKDGICEVDPTLFEKTLEGTGLTMETENQMQKHKTTAAAAFALAVGEKGLDAMKKNPDLEVVEAEMLIGKDKLGVVFQRSRNVPDMSGNGETKTVYGGTSMSYATFGASTNRGQVKVVKEILRDRATEAFGKSK